MPPIPVYTQSPIKPPPASSPSTTADQQVPPPPTTTTNLPPPPPPRAGPAPNPAFTTTTSSSSAAAPPPPSNYYPAAKPLPAAFAAPTAPAVNRYAPVQQQPTATRTIPLPENEGPPPPQPGAVPRPVYETGLNRSGLTAGGGGSGGVLPPPPKVGETLAMKAREKEGGVNQVQMSMPPQMGMGSLGTGSGTGSSGYRAQPVGGVTSMAEGVMESRVAYPVALGGGSGGSGGGEDGVRRSLEHPPGYVQNPHASDYTSDQRRAQREAILAAQNHNSSSSGGILGGGGGGGGGSSGVGGGFDDGGGIGAGVEGVWNTAKAWAKSAGEKVAEAEAEVWRRVEGKK